METIAKLSLPVTLATLVMLIVARMGACTIEALETRIGRYPIISQKTIELKGDLEQVETAFAEECEHNKSIEADFYRLVDCSDASPIYQWEGEDEWCRKEHGCTDLEHPCPPCEQLAASRPPPLTCDEQRAKTRMDLEASNQRLHDSVSRRKELARQLSFGFVKSFALGTTRYTHTTWECPQPYASFDYEVTVSLTKTY